MTRYDEVIADLRNAYATSARVRDAGQKADWKFVGDGQRRFQSLTLRRGG